MCYYQKYLKVYIAGEMIWKRDDDNVTTSCDQDFDVKRGSAVEESAKTNMVTNTILY